MARSYLLASLLSKPAYISQRFNPEEFDLDLDKGTAQSNAAHWNAVAKAMFGSFWDDEDDDDDDKDFAFADGIAMIPITGVLYNRMAYSCDWFTGYNAVRSQMQAAMADPSVKGIIFDVNSPGGMVQGCMELADEIYSMRGQKPMCAVVDGNCTSAAYALASSADQVIATRSADVGSIGVVAMHADLSGALEQAGVKITYIYAGKHKVDGNPFQPLSKDVKADVQASVDNSYEDFVALVARNRGMNAQAVRDTEAQIYSAPEAKQMGLIDAVSTPQDAISAFRSGLSGSTFQLGASAMTEKTTPVASITAPELEASVATARKEATAQERTRINAILTSPEAKDRTALATHLALSTDMTVEAAKGVLAASPTVAAKEEPKAQAAADSNFAKAMDKTPNPNVAAGDGGGDGEKKPDLTAQILGNYSAATGNKFKAA